MSDEKGFGGESNLRRRGMKLEIPRFAFGGQRETQSCIE